jgi:hypothetical protein
VRSGRASALIKLNINHELSGLFFSSIEEELSLIYEPIVGMFTGTTMMSLSLMERTPKKDKLKRRSAQRENRSRALDPSAGFDHCWIQENLHVL